MKKPEKYLDNVVLTEEAIWKRVAYTIENATFINGEMDDTSKRLLEGLFKLQGLVLNNLKYSLGYSSYCVENELYAGYFGREQFKNAP